MLIPPNCTFRPGSSNFGRVIIARIDGVDLATPPAPTPGGALLVLSACLDNRQPWGTHLDIIGQALPRLLRLASCEDEFDLAADRAMCGDSLSMILDGRASEEALVRIRAETLRSLVVDLDEVRSCTIERLETNPYAAALRADPLWTFAAGAMLVGSDRAFRYACDLRAWGITLGAPVDNPDGSRSYPCWPWRDVAEDLLDDAWVDRMVSNWFATPDRHDAHRNRLMRRQAPGRSMNEAELADGFEVLKVLSGQVSKALMVATDARGVDYLAMDVSRGVQS